MTDTFDIDGYDNIQYHTPAGLLPYGLTAKIGYAPSTNTGADDYLASGAARSPVASNLGTTTAGGLTVTPGGNSVTHYQVKANEIPFLDGVTVGADYLEFSGVNGAKRLKSHLLVHILCDIRSRSSSIGYSEIIHGYANE